MPTIYDVAKAAGVSTKTVSRVLNGEGPVGKATREAVEGAMSDLEYIPSFAARKMRSHKSGLIGLITGAISLVPQQAGSTGLPDVFIVQGIQKTLQERGMTLLISDTGGEFGRAEQLMRTFSAHRVEGLIYVAAYHQQVDLPSMPGLSRVVIANGFDAAGTPCVLPDDRLGQERLVRGLITRGHTRIAYITLSPKMVATRLRFLGYRDALDAAGLPFDPELVIPGEPDVPAADASTQLLLAAIERILDQRERPTVICVGNDLMAMRIYGLLRSRGIRIPEDISIAGFDNYSQIAETLYPALTSAELPYAEIGVRAAELLIRLINGARPDGSPSELVSGSVFWRDSVLPVRIPST